MRVKTWPAFAIAAIIMGGLLIAAWLRHRPGAAAEQARYLPESVGTILVVDVARLAALGALPPGDAPQEADYRQFVEQTGFRYQRDLRSVVAGFDGPHTYAVAEGVFDWNRLRRYAESHGGSCQASQCRMPGSTPGRQVAWFPLEDTVLAIASSPDPAVVNHLAQPKPWVTDRPAPRGPVWLSLKGAGFLERIGLGAFAGALQSAQRITLFMDHSGSAGLRLNFAAQCGRPSEAVVLADRLTAFSLDLAAQSRPAPAGLAGLLARGRFQARGAEVTGFWPLPGDFVSSLLKGE